jgi:hypothetical protein
MFAGNKMRSLILAKFFGKSLFIALFNLAGVTNL